MFIQVMGKQINSSLWGFLVFNLTLRSDCHFASNETAELMRSVSDNSIYPLLLVQCHTWREI